MGDYVLAIHGGAGTIANNGADETPHKEGLLAALSAGQRVLEAGGSAVDAVVAAVSSMEDFHLFNAGHGSVYNADAKHELDASVMDGATLRAGAVAGVRTVRNPVQLAQRVMDQSTCVFLIAEGAERFALEQGLPVVPDGYFHTDARLAQLRRVQQRGGGVVLDHTAEALMKEPLNEDRKMGTVGAVALDSQGRLAAATSTGGMVNKRPGRVGDTPVVGAGVYANNATCAVSCTGSGEFFIRSVVGHDIHARMQYGGASLETAANTVVHETLTKLGGTGGLVAVDRHGNVVMPFNTVGMYRGVVRRNQAPLAEVFYVGNKKQAQ
jgi:L-asparaginase / beta-aspartyl-peptidase